MYCSSTNVNYDKLIPKIICQKIKYVAIARGTLAMSHWLARQCQSVWIGIELQCLMTTLTFKVQPLIREHCFPAK